MAIATAFPPPRQSAAGPSWSRRVDRVDPGDVSVGHVDIGQPEDQEERRDDEGKTRDDPASHPDLLVRVSGYSAYFNDLSPAMKQFITALKGPLGNIPAFRKKIEALLSDEDAKKKLMKELGLGE